MQDIETDKLYRFLFQNRNVRGEIARLNESYELAINTHLYPKAIQNILGEMLVATSLLTASLKFEGQITLQLQGNGLLKLAVVNGDHQQKLRAVARYDTNLSVKDNASLQELVGDKAILAIMISPLKGEKYQGIINVDKPTLSECLENYFKTSEQLPTQIILKADKFKNKLIAAGMLLQIIPNEDKDEVQTDFEELSLLTSTITQEELFSLNISDILYRLYNQEIVELFQPSTIEFKCGCSREKCENAIMLCSKEEIDDIIDADKGIDMLCDYCNVNYHLSINDIKKLVKEKHKVN